MGFATPSAEWTVDFVLREGQNEIPCRISFAALRRQAGADELSRERAERILNWYRLQIERIALARYAVGDLENGMVIIDAGDIGSPPVPR